jgi:hypothetical protein
MAGETHFIVTYRNPEDNKIVSIRAKNIKDSKLGLSFVTITDFMFEKSTGGIIDPNEEKTRIRFEYTKSFHLSIYTILSIEEVGKDHPGLKFIRDKSNLVVFPTNNK